MSPNLGLDFLKRLWQPGEVRELRIPRHNRFGHTASGYFDSPEKLAVASRKWDGKANIYVTLNPVEPSLLARARASNRIVERAEKTTSDNACPSTHLAVSRYRRRTAPRASAAPMTNSLTHEPSPTQ